MVHVQIGQRVRITLLQDVVDSGRRSLVAPAGTTYEGVVDDVGDDHAFDVDLDDTAIMGFYSDDSTIEIRILPRR